MTAPEIAFAGSEAKFNIFAGELPKEIASSFLAASQARGVGGDLDTLLGDSTVMARSRQSAQGHDRSILTADSLPTDVTRELSSTVLRNGRYLSPAYTRLRTVNVVNVAGTSLFVIPRIGDEAEIREGMNPEDHGHTDKLDLDTVMLSIPYLYGYVSFPASAQAAWGQYEAEASNVLSRNMARALEQRVFAGTGQYAGAQGRGFNHASIGKPAGAVGNADWSASATTADQRKNGVKAIIREFAEARKYGPIDCYVSPESDAELVDDYSANYSRIERERLLEMLGGGMIVPTHGGQTNRTYFVIPSEDDCRLALPIPPRIQTWVSPYGFMREILVVARMAPAFASSQDGNIAARYIGP